MKQVETEQASFASVKFKELRSRNTSKHNMGPAGYTVKLEQWEEEDRQLATAGIPNPYDTYPDDRFKNWLRAKSNKIVKLEHIPKCHNSEANRLAQGASGYRSILTVELSAEDWRKEILDYLKYPSKKVDKQLRYKAIKYVLLEDELYYRTIDGVLLRCLGEEEAKTLMREIHESVGLITQHLR
jgi:hypothetical protein